MKIEVLYFALLSQQAGCSRELLETPPLSAAALYEAAARRHGFTLPLRQVRAAVNDRFVDWSHEVKEGDVLAFLPPMSGG